MTETPEYNPTAIFLHIQNRLRECRLTGERMPAAEASQSFSQLFQACQSLITTNERLRQAVAISDSIVSELEIELCMKDLEIFNFTNHSEEKDSN